MNLRSAPIMASVPALPTLQRQPAEVLGPRAQETIQRIVDATREVFLERGYAGTTIEEIAKVADVARASVYTYFGSKRDLLLAVGEKAADYTGLYIERLGEVGTTRLGLRQWVEEYFDLLDIYGSFAFAWTQAASQDDRISGEGRRRHLRLAKKFGTTLASTGGRTPEDPIALGIVAFSLLERSWAYSKLYGESINLDSVKAETTSSLWAMVRETRTEEAKSKK